ncbi:MAG: hypothetical protein V4697_02520 [Patescibacteria group bacterium]
MSHQEALSNTIGGLFFYKIVLYSVESMKKGMFPKTAEKLHDKRKAEAQQRTFIDRLVDEKVGELIVTRHPRTYVHHPPHFGGVETLPEIQAKYNTSDRKV